MPYLCVLSYAVRRCSRQYLLMDGEAVADRLTNTCEAEQREQREAMERSLTRDEERIEVLDKMVMRLYEDMICLLYTSIIRNSGTLIFLPLLHI